MIRTSRRRPIVDAIVGVVFVFGTAGAFPATAAGSVGDAGNITIVPSAPLPPEFDDFAITFAESLEAGGVTLGRGDVEVAPSVVLLQASGNLHILTPLEFDVMPVVHFEATHDIVAGGPISIVAELLCQADADRDGAGEVVLLGSAAVAGSAIFAGERVSLATVVAHDIAAIGPTQASGDLIATVGDAIIIGGLALDASDLSQNVLSFDGDVLIDGGVSAGSPAATTTLRAPNGIVRIEGDVFAIGDLLVEGGEVFLGGSLVADNAAIAGDVLCDGPGNQMLRATEMNLVILGTLDKATAGALLVRAENILLLTGDVTVSGGPLVAAAQTLRFEGHAITVVGGEVDLSATSVIEFAGSPAVITAPAVHFGEGEIRIDGGGTTDLTIDGDASLGGDTTLRIDIDAATPPASDRLVVNGVVAIDGGSLTVPGPGATIGSVFDVIVADEVTGTFGSVDLPPNGVVMYESDRVRVRFESPTAVGACCLPAGWCWFTTFQPCVAVGGAWQGAYTSCANVTCPVADGACCLTDTNCVITTIAACQTVGGTYQGHGTTCATCVPALGACCLLPGDCVDGIPASACFVQAGIYQGDGSACDAAPCPAPTPPGACCLDDNTCSEVTLIQCAASGGLFQGETTLCSTVTCPDLAAIGACCYAGGTCGFSPAIPCLQVGGTWMGANTSCAASPCPPPTGACCYGTSCEILEPGQCSTIGGTYQGTGTTCATPCPPATATAPDAPGVPTGSQPVRR